MYMKVTLHVYLHHICPNLKINIFQSTILVLGYSTVKDDLPIMHIEMVSIFRSTRNNNNIHIFIIPLVVLSFTSPTFNAFIFWSEKRVTWLELRLYKISMAEMFWNMKFILWINMGTSQTLDVSLWWHSTTHSINVHFSKWHHFISPLCFPIFLLPIPQKSG